MWEGLLNSIRQMGVFMICAQALIYFKPKGSYEKYLKLLVSAMILVQLLSPVAALLSGKGGQSLEERIVYYTNSFEQGMGAGALEEYRMEQIRQHLLTSQISAQLEEWDWQSRQEESLSAEADSALAPQAETVPGRESGEEGEIRIQIDPVTIGTSQEGQ